MLRPEDILWRIKEASLRLCIVCDTAEGIAHALASLDRSFAAVSTRDNSSLTFSCRIEIGPRLFKRITKIVPNPLRLLDEKGRLFLELYNYMDKQYLQLKDSEESGVTGDANSEHELENSEESAPQ
ncbi:uncharacterized protein PHACADRAFT_196309 [Phanerochaete carnosa HHB-10118-sp]|uniref:Uncharacterized protein n=1 Tax=Phanerochaete carnosa (strain HHB-10118-sp) TaxID=650164 RepID=K5WTX1_PHACS|nr:uncharacterized protein PHACADRAFT_196309 [Phanerochaete carnosa HHB-10118-sp]EKM53867.1 hypothetical protein PHACADRAFT_196309 [Phanerochaete carnosa HHB-10118-sp]